jgi:hypothetical protein
MVAITQMKQFDFLQFLESWSLMLLDHEREKVGQIQETRIPVPGTKSNTSGVHNFE